MITTIVIAYLMTYLLSYSIGNSRRIGGKAALISNVIFPGLGVILALISKRKNKPDNIPDRQNEFISKSKRIKELQDSLIHQIIRRGDHIEQEKQNSKNTGSHEKKQKADISKLSKLRKEESDLFRDKHESSNSILTEDYIAIRKNIHSDGHLSFDLPYNLPKKVRLIIEGTINDLIKESGLNKSQTNIRTGPFVSTNFDGYALQRGDLTSTTTLIYNAFSGRIETLSEHYSVDIDHIIPHIDAVDAINSEINQVVFGTEDTSPAICRDSFGVACVNGDTFILHYEGQAIAYAVPGEHNTFAFRGLIKDLEASPLVLAKIENVRSKMSESRNMTEWLNNAKTICHSAQNIKSLGNNIRRPLKEIAVEPAKRKGKTI